MENKMILKISSKSNPNSVAGAIAGGLQENKRVELQAIGAGAVNQSMKAIAIARSFVAASGVDLLCIPAFCTVIVENEEKTGMKFIIKEEKEQETEIEENDNNEKGMKVAVGKIEGEKAEKFIKMMKELGVE